MDLYTLTDTFLAKDNIDEFVSAIWAERYSVAGDVRLVVEPTTENIERLKPGTYLALRGSKDVMILDTQNIENGLLTVQGQAQVSFLDQRFVWARNPDSSAVGDRVVDYTEDLVLPSIFLQHVVDKMVVNPVAFTGAWVDANLTWANEIIPNFVVDATVGGVVDDPLTGQEVAKRMTMPIGPLYAGISQMAAKEGIGIRVILYSANELGFSLKFQTYKGLNRTSSQVVNPLVRLTPELDSIYDLKEVRSNALHKNVCYVYYRGKITKHLAEPTLPEPLGMQRRVVVTSATGEPVTRKTPTTPERIMFGGGGLAPSAPPVSNNAGASYLSGYTSYTIDVGAEETAFRDQHAKDIFANANYIRAIDGQTSPQNDYKFGTDYNLGDILELEGITGALSKVRVTEFIRSQDATGEKEYPTISVVT